MSNNIDDLQMLRLIKAFQRVKDAKARRAIILHVEEQAKKDELAENQDPKSSPS
ncbi:hypothetical protein ACVWZK_001669 [Bradyrhizobium sp. GM0.4]